MLKAFSHTGFGVRDLDRAIVYHTNVMGLRMESAGDFVCQLLAFDAANIQGSFPHPSDGHQLGLIQYVSSPGGAGVTKPNHLGASHLPFFVENIDGFYTEKSKNGLRFNSEPASLYDDNGGLLRKAPYSQDPDGS